ncbi:CPBP family intramembrane glutamic endopeptidase [Sinisalibacter aestuarii]|nr:type II CAAX endopeptidase family protein [Sinisalibacter aestuarii]
MTHPPFWQPALARNQIWRSALGTVLIFAVWVAASFGAITGGAALIGRPVWEVARGNDPASAAAFFASFIGFHIALAIVLPLLHRRRYRSLFGPEGRLNPAHLWRGAAVTLGIATVLYALIAVEHAVLPAGVSPPLELNLPPATWALILLPALALIFLQVLAEEAVFRGYLLQQLRARFRSPLIWAVAPSLLFGLLHFDATTYGTINAAAYVLNATLMGTFAAFVTLRTGNLAAAIGLHFGNNAALAAIGLKGNLAGFSLFVVEMELRSGYATYSILTQTAAMAVIFALWWRWMARHRPIANSGDAA